MARDSTTYLRTVPPLRRARLAAEILVTYRRAKRAAKRHRDIREAIAEVRDASARQAPVSATPLTVQEAAWLGVAVRRMLRTLPALDDRCLAQSMVLTGVLARRRTPNTLVIGARPGAEFGAHAWIEVDGVAVLATDDAAYPRLVEL